MDAASIERERAVLGSMLVDAGAALECLGILQGQDFARSAHGWVFEAIRALQGRGAAVDVISVHEELSRQGRANAEDLGLQGLSDLTADVAAPAAVAYHATRIADIAVLRRLRSAGQKIADALSGDGPMPASADEALGQAQALLDGVRSRARTAGSVWMPEVVFQRWEEFKSTAGTKAPAAGGWPTGLTDLDDLIGGFRDGELTYIGARPSVGKSALGLDLCMRRARTAPVLFCSLEMSRQMLADRMISWSTGLQADWLRRGMYSRATLDAHAEALQAAMADSLMLHATDTPGATTDAIAADAWRLKAQGGLGLIVIDYLTLLGDRRRQGENQATHVAAMSQGLQRLTRSIGCPVIVMAQLNREVERRDDGEPRMSDFRDSGGIEQDADVVLLLWRNKGATGDGPVALNAKVEKQRNGATGKFRLLFDPTTGRFANLARRDAA
ncbi:replicative DNA helicase [Thiomonas sp.]